MNENPAPNDLSKRIQEERRRMQTNKEEKKEAKETAKEDAKATCNQANKIRTEILIPLINDLCGKMCENQIFAKGARIQQNADNAGTWFSCMCGGTSFSRMDISLCITATASTQGSAPKKVIISIECNWNNPKSLGSKWQSLYKSEEPLEVDAHSVDRNSIEKWSWDEFWQCARMSASH